MAGMVEESFEGIAIRENFDELMNESRLASFNHSKSITPRSSDVLHSIDIVDKVNSDETGEIFRDFVTYTTDHLKRPHVGQILTRTMYMHQGTWINGK